jgi:hypothetical protein
MKLASPAFAGVVAASLLLLGGALLPTSVFAQGCAMCKTALDGPADPLTEAFNVSSLFLMATPYTVVGTIGAWIYLSSRRHARRLDVDADAPDLQ